MSFLVKIAFLACCTVLLVKNAESAGMSYSDFFKCAYKKLCLSDISACATWKMLRSYNKMVQKSCRNCDKYFHCQGNYDAVYQCEKTSAAKKTAEVISDCREFAQGGADSPDSQADQAANRFGRSGGNCGKRYLCAVNCKYNPADDTCLKTNCGSGK